MWGCGLKEALSLIYAAKTVEKILTGSEYAKAVRGHLIVSLVFLESMLESFTITKEHSDFLKYVVVTKRMILTTEQELQELTKITDGFNEHVLKNYWPNR